MDLDDRPDPEPDPEPDEFDPHSLGPEVPSVDTEEIDVPVDLRRAFWSVVAMVNVGLLAVSLGAMLVGFRGAWETGVPLVGVGVVAFAWAYYRYRSFVEDEG